MFKLEKVERQVTVLNLPEPPSIANVIVSSSSIAVPIPKTNPQSVPISNNNPILSPGAARMFNRVERTVQRLATPERSSSHIKINLSPSPSPTLSPSPAPTPTRETTTTFRELAKMSTVRRKSYMLTDDQVNEAYAIEGRFRAFSINSQASQASQDEDLLDFPPSPFRLNFHSQKGLGNNNDAVELSNRDDSFDKNRMFQKVRRKTVLLGDIDIFDRQEVIVSQKIPASPPRSRSGSFRRRSTVYNKSNDGTPMPPSSPERLFAKVLRRPVTLPPDDGDRNNDIFLSDGGKNSSCNNNTASKDDREETQLMNTMINTAVEDILLGMTAPPSSPLPSSSASSSLPISLPSSPLPSSSLSSSSLSSSSLPSQPKSKVKQKTLQYNVLFDRVTRKTSMLPEHNATTPLRDISDHAARRSTRWKTATPSIPMTGREKSSSMGEIGEITQSGALVTQGEDPLSMSLPVNIPPSLRRSKSTDRLDSKTFFQRRRDRRKERENEIESQTTIGRNRMRSEGGGVGAVPPPSSQPSADLDIPQGYHVSCVLLKHPHVTVALLSSITDSTYSVVLKQIYLSNTTDRRVQSSALSERRAHEKVGHHPFICSCLAAYATDGGDLCLLLKYCRGGNLLERIRKEGGLPIQSVRIMFAQIISAISHCHEKGVAHRDIKPENIMLTDPRSTSTRGDGRFNNTKNNTNTNNINQNQNSGGFGKIALSDFGLASRKCSWTKGSTIAAGTPQYTSPEVAKGLEHGLAVDSWSLGILLWEMLVGYTPFQTTAFSSIKIIQMLRNIDQHMYIFKLSKSILIPKEQREDLEELLNGLLVANPIHRWNIQQIQHSKWFADISWSDLKEGRSPLVPRSTGK